MSVDGINASFQTNIAQNASGAHAAEGAKGLFMGHAVQVEASPASILADAAEELGFSVDRTKDYELQQRKQREKGDISQEMIKRYQAMLMQRSGQNEAMDASCSPSSAPPSAASWPTRFARPSPIRPTPGRRYSPPLMSLMRIRP